MIGSIELKQFLRIVGISFVGSFCLTFFTCTSCHTSANHYAIVTFFSFWLWMFLWIGNDFLTHFLNRKISWVNFPVGRLIVGIVTTVVYTVTTVFVIILLWEAIFNFDIGSYSWTISFALVITFLISLFM